MILTGKVVGINVDSANVDYTQGQKGRWAGQYYSGGTIHIRNGYGGQLDITPKRIHLFVDVGNRTVDVRVDSDFRYVVGNLTPKRTKVICATVPKTVTLYENETRKGQKFYCLAEGSFNEWLNNTGL